MIKLVSDAFFRQAVKILQERTREEKDEVEREKSRIDEAKAELAAQKLKAQRDLEQGLAKIEQEFPPTCLALHTVVCLFKFVVYQLLTTIPPQHHAADVMHGQRKW